MVIFSGQSDPRRIASLNGRNVTFELVIKSGKKAEIGRSEWQIQTASDGRALDEEVEKAKRAFFFLAIKSTYVYGSSMAVLGPRSMR